MNREDLPPSTDERPRANVPDDEREEDRRSTIITVPNYVDRIIKPLSSHSIKSLEAASLRGAGSADTAARKKTDGEKEGKEEREKNREKIRNIRAVCTNSIRVDKKEPILSIARREERQTSRRARLLELSDRVGSFARFSLRNGSSSTGDRAERATTGTGGWLKPARSFSRSLARYRLC